MNNDVMLPSHPTSGNSGKDGGDADEICLEGQHKPALPIFLVRWMEVAFPQTLPHAVDSLSSHWTIRMPPVEQGWGTPSERHTLLKASSQMVDP